MVYRGLIRGCICKSLAKFGNSKTKWIVQENNLDIGLGKPGKSVALCFATDFTDFTFQHLGGRGEASRWKAASNQGRAKRGFFASLSVPHGMYLALQHIHGDMNPLITTTVKLQQIAYTDLIVSLASFNSTLFAREALILQQLTPSALTVLSPPDF